MKDTLALQKPATMMRFWEMGHELRVQYEQIGAANVPESGAGWTVAQREAIKAVEALNAALDGDLPQLAAKMLLAQDVKKTASEYPGEESLKHVVEHRTRLNYTEFNSLINLFDVVIPSLERIGVNPLEWLSRVKTSNWYDITGAIRYLTGQDSSNRPLSPVTQNVVDGMVEEARLLDPEGSDEVIQKHVAEQLLEAATGTCAAMRKTLRPGTDLDIVLVDGQFFFGQIHDDDEMTTVLKKFADWATLFRVSRGELESIPAYRAFAQYLFPQDAEAVDPEEKIYTLEEAMQAVSKIGETS